MLANLIREHALADAQDGKWLAVASTLNAMTRDVYVGRVGGKASLAALVGAGIDPNTVIAQMRSVPMASELLNTLTASGVDWSDDLTAMVMRGLVDAGKITQQTVTVMRGLSLRTEPVIVTTEEECAAAFEADQVQTIWTTALNEGINAAVAAGDREALKAALAAAIEVL